MAEQCGAAQNVVLISTLWVFESLKEIGGQQYEACKGVPAF